MTDLGPRRTDSDPCAGARLMFDRVLRGWAMDVLSLRRRGLDRPGYRTARGAAPAAPIESEMAHARGPGD